ncbi:hypothetical protein F5883DRAFT_639635 [Diaporthe sp. PMI_573]|nr:hypothetical protein F5883DRAFT_639635 [Diaporthaceae sp. PMI_573]
MIDGAHVYDFDAAKVHETPKHVDIHDKTLKLSGNCFDEVIAVGYVADPYFKSDKGSEHLRLTAAASIFHMIALGLDWLLIPGELSEKKYPNGQNAFESFVRTIYLDDFSGLYSADEVTEYYGNLYIPFYLLSKESKMRSPGLSKMYKYACLQLNIIGRLFGPAPLRTLARVVGKIEQQLPSCASWKLQSSSPDTPRKGSISQTVIDAANRSMYRRMLRTRLGYFGLGPRLTQKGDRVFLVKGCRAALMLHAQGLDGWTLLGDCYVHGIMHGEAFDESQSQCFFVI